MPPLAFNDVGVTGDSRGDWHRNIVSLRTSVDIFADLVDDPVDQAVLVQHEMATKPFIGQPPIITRPFEEPEVVDPIAEAIAWPFEHPCRSRFSNGNFGVWYGSDSLLTSVYETAYHFRVDTLASAAVEPDSIVVQDRRAHLVTCTAALIDLRPHNDREPGLLDPLDYSVCQLLGAQLQHAALPGVLNRSARHAAGQIVGVFRLEALMDPRTVCYLTYHLDVNTSRVRIERELGQTLVEIGA